jgi:hypothetical protein
VPGNRLLKITYDAEREEVTGGWRKLHNEELHDLYSSSDVITVIGIESAQERDEKRLHSYLCAEKLKGRDCLYLEMK